MRTFEQIYADIIADTGKRFTIRQLLEIYERESDWVGTPEQLLQLREMSTEITGIRPGTCIGCNLEVLKNMARWTTNYELKHGTNSNGGVRHSRKSKK